MAKKRKKGGKKKGKKRKSKKKKAGTSRRGPISYTPCRDSKGRFSKKTRCRT